MPRKAGDDGQDRRRCRAALRRRDLLALPVTLAAADQPARAQPAWAPSRPLILIVTSVAGSMPDLICRLVGDGMSRLLGPVVIQNRPGGFGTLGLAEVARAQPDGHTIGYCNVVTMAINDAMLRRQPYVAERDFAPVALLGFVQNAVLVHPTLPARTLADLLALLRDAPGRFTYGSPGTGTTGHLAMELLRSLSGVELVHVPYRGSPQLAEALRKREVDIACDSLSSLEALLRVGDARGLAVTGPQRTPLFPDLPTVEEAGWPGFRITSWGGLVVPSGTPAAAVSRLNAVANAALAMPDLAARLTALAFEASPGQPQALFDLAAQEKPIWADLVRRSGARAD
ncbi:tripartite tricarboxylate transporter substrate binding protein [Falsiroseomonas sp.]|uniref:Bug family tripartite tricarboxylate transporter substrate binding protein n=1 Tax=Falsiroseomonas sp. TaxID=2870721 RepID=UPI002724B157|nr:tripartite tricarboxylate transporter substrate-binding protein [Falsiroseomonas sp.]MDO9503050.1 tripartite tricarboxylate transporter substrate-binding protein [Falsiroseomonas sp.]